MGLNHHTRCEWYELHLNFIPDNRGGSHADMGLCLYILLVSPI